MISVEGNTLRLSGEATIHCARELHDELSAALKGLTGPVTVRADELQALDLLGAQVLLAVRASLAPTPVSFEGWSKPIADFLKTAGLSAHFA
jgi:hypothetical protein